MPIYEYECSQCGRIEEVIQKFSDAPLATCKSCSGELHKIVSQSSFHLKGSGWYVTDYASKTKATPAEKKQPSTPNESSAGSGGEASKATPAASGE